MTRFVLLSVVAALGLTTATPAQLLLPVPVDAVPVSPVPPVVRALTLREFADTDFRAGRYTLFVIHPCTNCPVKVCFNLPACPRAVRTSSNVVVLRWGVLPSKRVAVRFLPDGTVSVVG